MKNDAGQNAASPGRDAEVRGQKMKCEDIQPLLFDYMNRELGSARSALVREHLRRCAVCQASAAEIQATVDALHGASPSKEGTPAHLSEKHRARILHAITHPISHWIDRHHAVVSLIALVVAAILVWLFLRHFELWWEMDEEPITITIGAGPAPDGAPAPTVYPESPAP